MSIEVFPVPSAEQEATAYSITATAANTQYRDTLTFTPAIYRITCVSGTVATVDFYANNVFIVRGVTVSGTIDVSLGSTADDIRVFTNTGTNVIVTITNLADILTNDFPSGTLDTITATGTYTGTSDSGFGYALVIGGGGSGASNGGDGSATGGSAGGIGGKVVALTGSMPVTIGAGGTAVSNGNGVAGGNTTFAGITANGGDGGILGNSLRAGGTASGGTFAVVGGRGGSWDYRATASSSMPYTFISSGTIGGGNGVLNSGNVDDSKAGSVLGVGGAGATTTNPAITNATGFGAGGGGVLSNRVSGTGAPGVVFVLRY